MHRRTRWAAGAVPFAVLSILMSCKDLPTDSIENPGRTIQNLVGCRVEVATGITRCEPLSPDGKPLDKVSLNLIPDAQWMVQTEAGAYTSADSTYRFNLRVTNDTESTLGTPDGVQATGLKVFLPVRVMGYARQPGNTSDPYGMLIPPIQNTNNTVHARNPDGVASFTAEGQPYWNYPQILQPWESTDWKQWQFTVDPGVAYFYFAVSIFTHVAGEQPVASSAPEAWLIPQDSVDQLFAQQNLVFAHPRMSGPYPRNVVAVVFSPTAADDEKQAAVDRIGGTLVGGDGVHYYVRVTNGTVPVWTAIDQLSAMPQVEAALPVLFGVQALYRRPNNGAGWERKDWEVHPDSARGANWGPEAISAPSAWGCETGSSSVKVAVVDVAPNHAAAVGGVVGSPGNTGSGYTGIMWDRNLIVSDASRGGTLTSGNAANDSLHVDFRRAIKDQRASVINISLGAPYTDSLGNLRPPVGGDTADLNRAHAFADTWRRRLERAEAQSGHQPLYVIAAGNDGIDAAYGGFALLGRSGSLAPRVLIVAANDSMRTGSGWALWSSSNTGAHIAAPGANLPVYGYTGSQSGTSLAAPHVAGIAGLLFSQVPTRTAVEVRDYIMTGAARGARTAGGHPVANAYESLRRGAEDSGAPLCGNRVWAFGAQIYARRGGASEAIGPADGGLVGDLLTQHGGRAILYNSTAGGGKAILRQNDGTWALGAIPPDFNQQIGGATWSERAYAHTPADSLIGLDVSTLNNNLWWRTGSQVQVRVMLRYLNNGVATDKQIGTLTVPDLPEPEGTMCVERTTGGFCTYRQYSGRYWVSRVAYPQAYQPVLITMTALDLPFADSTPWVTCTRDPSLQCRTTRTDYRWSHTRVYRMPLTGGTPQLVDSLPKPVLWMGQSEAPGSDTLVMGSGKWIVESVFDPNKRASTTTRSEVEGCGIQYRSLGAFATVAHEIANPITCDFTSFTTAANHGLGSFAPIRAPDTGGGASAVPGEWRARIEDMMPLDRTRRAQRPRR